MPRRDSAWCQRLLETSQGTVVVDSSGAFEAGCTSKTKQLAKQSQPLDLDKSLSAGAPKQISLFHSRRLPAIPDSDAEDPSLCACYERLLRTFGVIYTCHETDVSERRFGMQRVSYVQSALADFSSCPLVVGGGPRWALGVWLMHIAAAFWLVGASGHGVPASIAGYGWAEGVTMWSCPVL